MFKKLAIIMISAMTAFAGVAPAQALPMAQVAPVEARSDVQQVQYRDDRHHVRRYDRRYDRRDRYSDRRYDRRDRYSRNRYRDGYRHHNNTGAIIGGLAAGAIIGGAIASQNRGGSSCASRYRSYRASDNTYQPSSGPRRVCR